MTDFFISYTQADREWARWIKAVLIAAGYSVRLQHDDIPPGSNFPVEMHKALIECDRTIAVLSPEYQRSRFGTAEWGATFVQDPIGETRKLVPVRVKEVKPEGLLASIVFIDLVGLGEAAALGELLTGLKKGAGPQEGMVFPGDSSPTFPGPPASPPVVDAALTRLHGLPLDKIPDPAPLPAGSWMPHAVNPMFVGRDEDLRELARALGVGKSAAIGQIAAATGLGGVGKTQLASEFVHRYGQFFEGGVFWMSFAVAPAIPAEVAACGRNLGLHPQFTKLPLEQQVQLVRNSWQSPLQRLLVFDNCEKTDLLQTWRPTTGRARVLLTSRRARWDPSLGIYSHALETLSEAASIDLLRRFRPDLSDGPILVKIAQELGNLPLALHLAGNYLQRYRHTTLGDPEMYLEQLRRGGLLDHPSLQGQYTDLSPTSHDAHVARTFALSYERLDPNDSVDALAQRLLARGSYFTPGEPISRDLLKATLRPSEDASIAMAAEEALGRLIDLGLLDEREDGNVVMHPLVAHFAKQGKKELEDRRALEDTLFEEAILEPEQPDTAFYLNSLGSRLRDKGDLSGARSHYERALAIREKVLGPEHPDTAASLNNLGTVLKDLNDLPGARSHYERALAVWEKVLGPEHPNTAASLNNLGALLQDLGDLSGARLWYERALVIREKVLGPEHPDTALSLNNLGMVLQALGDLSGARSCWERALAICENVLGPEHPYTKIIRKNLELL